VLLQEFRVHAVRRPADVDRLQVPIEQLVDRRARARVPALVDLAEHADASGLGQRRGFRSGRNDLYEAVPLPRERVLARVHTDA
jgi:hypothetical protein